MKVETPLGITSLHPPHGPRDDWDDSKDAEALKLPRIWRQAAP